MDKPKNGLRPGAGSSSLHGMVWVFDGFAIGAFEMRVKLLLILVGLNLVVYVLSIHDEAFYQLAPHQYQISTSESGETIVAVHISILGSGVYFAGLMSGNLEFLNVIGLLFAIQGLSPGQSNKGPQASQHSPKGIA